MWGALPKVPNLREGGCALAAPRVWSAVAERSGDAALACATLAFAHARSSAYSGPEGDDPESVGAGSPTTSARPAYGTPGPAGLTPAERWLPTTGATHRNPPPPAPGLGQAASICPPPARRSRTGTPDCRVVAVGSRQPDRSGTRPIQRGQPCPARMYFERSRCAGQAVRCAGQAARAPCAAVPRHSATDTTSPARCAGGRAAAGAASGLRPADRPWRPAG